MWTGKSRREGALALVCSKAVTSKSLQSEVGMTDPSCSFVSLITGACGLRILWYSSQEELGPRALGSPMLLVFFHQNSKTLVLQSSCGRHCLGLGLFILLSNEDLELHQGRQRHSSRATAEHHSALGRQDRAPTPLNRTSSTSWKSSWGFDSAPCLCLPQLALHFIFTSESSCSAISRKDWLVCPTLSLGGNVLECLSTVAGHGHIRGLSAPNHPK